MVGFRDWVLGSGFVVRFHGQVHGWVSCSGFVVSFLGIISVLGFGVGIVFRVGFCWVSWSGFGVGFWGQVSWSGFIVGFFSWVF